MAECSELTEYELGYIAGIMDGEGCINLRKWKQVGCSNYSYQFKFNMTNTNRNILEFIQYLCGGGCISTTKPAKKQYKRSYTLSIPKCIMEKILPLISLIIKIKQQELALEAMSFMVGRRYSNSERDRLEEIYQELKKLNKRGVDIDE